MNIIQHHQWIKCHIDDLTKIFWMWTQDTYIISWCSTKSLQWQRLKYVVAGPMAENIEFRLDKTESWKLKVIGNKLMIAGIFHGQHVFEGN